MRKRVRKYVRAAAHCRVCSQGLSTETLVYFPLKSISFPLPYISVPILSRYTTVHILLQRGNGLLHKLHDAEPTRTNRELLRSASRAHQTYCEWAIGRLRAEMLRTAVLPVHMRIAKGLVRYEAQQVPTPPPSAAEEVVDSEPTMPETVTHWQEHFPWQYVTPQALNSRGEQIFYRVDSDQDRMWAWRLERAVDHTWANCQTTTRGT
jgi:hypothetical protein